MISLTPDEERVRDYLADLAAHAEPGNPGASAISYTRLAEELDPDGHVGWKRGYPRHTRLVTALYHVSTYEVEHGRPMPSAFVVHNYGDRQPGSGLGQLGKELGRPVGDGPDADYRFWQSEMR